MRTKELDKPLINRIIIKNITSSSMLIKNVVDIERTIEIKKTSLTLFLKIDEIDKSEPHRYPKKFHEAIKPPSVLVIFNSSNIKGSIGV
jgi:hypothetical protein